MGKKTRSSASTSVTQTEKAYEGMKGAILCGELPEGIFLVERQMMERYRIGRTPYREACNRLHYEGLLEVVPRRGYFVPEMSFHQVRELFEARLLVEGMIADLAARRATDEEIDELERSATIASRDAAFADIIKANKEFHCCLARMSRNRELARILNSLLDRTQRLMHIEIRYSGFRGEQFKMLHQPIAKAIRLRDPAAARAAVIEDISQAQVATFGKAIDGRNSGNPQDSGEPSSRPVISRRGRSSDPR